MWIVSICGSIVNFCEHFYTFSLVSFLMTEAARSWKSVRLLSSHYRSHGCENVRFYAYFHWLIYSPILEMILYLPILSASLHATAMQKFLTWISLQLRKNPPLDCIPSLMNTVNIFRAYVFKTILFLVPESSKMPHDIKPAHTNVVLIYDPFYAWCVLYLAFPSWLYYSDVAWANAE